MVANFHATDVKWSLPESIARLQESKLLTSNYGDLKVDEKVLALRPFEAFAIVIQ